jgi:hypothetical protein
MFERKWMACPKYDIDWCETPSDIDCLRPSKPSPLAAALVERGQDPVERLSESKMSLSQRLGAETPLPEDTDDNQAHLRVLGAQCAAQRTYTPEAGVSEPSTTGQVSSLAALPPGALHSFAQFWCFACAVEPRAATGLVWQPCTNARSACGWNSRNWNRPSTCDLSSSNPATPASTSASTSQP